MYEYDGVRVVDVLLRRLEGNSQVCCIFKFGNKVSFFFSIENLLLPKFFYNGKNIFFTMKPVQRVDTEM